MNNDSPHNAKPVYHTAEEIKCRASSGKSARDVANPVHNVVNVNNDEWKSLKVVRDGLEKMNTFRRSSLLSLRLRGNGLVDLFPAAR